MEISSGPPARNVFSVLPFLFGLLGILLGKVLECQLLSNFLLPRYLSNCSYDDVSSSFLCSYIAILPIIVLIIVNDVGDLEAAHTYHRKWGYLDADRYLAS